jgi:hypothetical protein
MSIRRSVLNLGRYPPSRLIDLARLQEDYGYETFAQFIGLCSSSK